MKILANAVVINSSGKTFSLMSFLFCIVMVATIGISALAQTASDEAALALTRMEWRKIQDMLASEGFDPGPRDGLPGPRIRNAIKALQEAKEEMPTGYLDIRLLERLLGNVSPRKTRSVEITSQTIRGSTTESTIVDIVRNVNEILSRCGEARVVGTLENVELDEYSVDVRNGEISFVHRDLGVRSDHDRREIDFRCQAAMRLFPGRPNLTRLIPSGVCIVEGHLVTHRYRAKVGDLAYSTNIANDNKTLSVSCSGTRCFSLEMSGFRYNTGRTVLYDEVDPMNPLRES